MNRIVRIVLLALFFGVYLIALGKPYAFIETSLSKMFGSTPSSDSQLLDVVANR